MEREEVDRRDVRGGVRWWVRVGIIGRLSRGERGEGVKMQMMRPCEVRRIVEAFVQERLRIEVGEHTGDDE
jgi:hypothetical protein